jgi:hypothetical protein
MSFMAPTVAHEPKYSPFVSYSMRATRNAGPSQPRKAFILAISSFDLGRLTSIRLAEVDDVLYGCEANAPRASSGVVKNKMARGKL